MAARLRWVGGMVNFPGRFGSPAFVFNPHPPLSIPYLSIKHVYMGGHEGMLISKRPIRITFHPDSVTRADIPSGLARRSR